MAKSSLVDHGTVTSVETVAAKDVGAEYLRHIHESLRIDEAWTERRERGFTWWAHRLAQHVDAGRPVDDDGIVVTRVTSRVPVVRGVTADEEAVNRVLAKWNFVSDSYCYVYDPATRAIESVQSDIVHEQIQTMLC